MARFSAIALNSRTISIRDAVLKLPMHRAWIETRLALAERQVTATRASIALQRIKMAGLKGRENTHSLTANMARDLLQSLKDELAMHLAERERLRHWMAKAHAGTSRK
jgi:hypothetical protein